MESIQLPQDLLWDGKMEPPSPSSELFSLTNSEESWFFDDNFAKDVLLNDMDEKFSLEGELLYEIELDVKDEQWLEGKPDPQFLTEFSPTVIQPQHSAQLVKVQNPYEILMDLEKTYDVTELTQLTPPQTPPQDANDVKEIYDMIIQHQPCTELIANNEITDDIMPVMSPTSSNYSSYDNASSPMSSDIAREMKIVDEILRNRAKDLPDWNDDDSMYSMSSLSNDDEWTPSSASSSDGNIVGKISDGSLTKRRVRPYGRGTEDKKSRKKEQNKNAATRYRQKKKQEMEEILEEERLLAKRNEELVRNHSEVEREIKYLKQLIREFYKSKSK